MESIQTYLYFGKPMIGVILLALVIGWLWMIHRGPLSFPQE